MLCLLRDMSEQSKTRQTGLLCSAFSMLRAKQAQHCKGRIKVGDKIEDIILKGGIEVKGKSEDKRFFYVI